MDGWMEHQKGRDGRTKKETRKKKQRLTIQDHTRPHKARTVKERDLFRLFATVSFMLVVAF